MKLLINKTITTSHVLFLSASLALVAASGCATSEHHASEAKLSRADAEKAALARVPNGTVKEGELEKEHGLLIWSFDISQPGTKDITEVHVNANTGEIVRVEKEDQAAQAKEAKEDAKKNGKEKEEDDEKNEKK